MMMASKCLPRWRNVQTYKLLGPRSISLRSGEVGFVVQTHHATLRLGLACTNGVCTKLLPQGFNPIDIHSERTTEASLGGFALTFGDLRGSSIGVRTFSSSSKSRPEKANPQNDKPDVAEELEKSTAEEAEDKKKLVLPLFMWYNTLWLISLGSIYTVLRTDVIEWERILGLLRTAFETLPFLKRIIDLDTLDPDHGKLGVALCINPIFEPFRIAFSAATIRPLMRIIKRGK